MTEKREIHPLVKSTLDFGPVLLFFVAYMYFKDDVFTIGGTEYSGFIIITAVTGVQTCALPI